jgi:hypothetical protein
VGATGGLASVATEEVEHAPTDETEDHDQEGDDEDAQGDDPSAGPASGSR